MFEKMGVDDPAHWPKAKTGMALWAGLWAILTFGFFVVMCR